MFKKFREEGHEKIFVIYLEVIDLKNEIFKIDYGYFLYMDDWVKETITNKGILAVTFIWDGTSLMLTY